GMTFDREGKFLALGTRGTKVGEGRVWEVDTDTGKERDPFKGDKREVSAVAFAPDGKTLAGVNGQQVWLWDLDGTKKERVNPLPHAHPARSIAFTPDGKTLATASGGGADGAVRLWNAATGQELAVLQAPGARLVAFTPDGKTLVTGHSNGTVKLWE